MTIKIYTTKETPYNYYGQKSYRIERKVIDGLENYQRHIWTDKNGNIETDEWIKGGRILEKDWQFLTEVTK